MLIPSAPAFGRRVVLGATALFIFLSLLYRQREAVKTRVLWSDASSHGAIPLEEADEWIRSADWDPSVSISDAFPHIDNLYGSSVFSLEGHGAGQKEAVNLGPTINQLSLSKVASTRRRIGCVGPRGNVLGHSTADNTYVYQGTPKGFPSSALGSPSSFGLEQDICVERQGRWSAYGLRNESETTSTVDWIEIDWAGLQRDCVDKNKARFDLSPRPDIMDEAYDGNKSKAAARHAQRTAILLRSHDTQIYTDDLKRNLRAVIQELNLHTGGEYEVFLLVEIKDPALRILEDPQLYKDLIQRLVPAEFQNITVLWNEWRWRDEYPMLPEDTYLVHKSQWLPVQYFQKLHPEFDFYWNWEMDVRYTGSSYYALVDTVTDWAESQPRKGLWERSSRFYIPRIHGTYRQYRDTVQARYQDGTKDVSIWGPLFPEGKPSETQKTWLSRLRNLPPVASPSQDRYKWGVGEQADFITFLPMFDPDTTKYVYQDAYFNYPPNIDSDDMHRRTTIITFSRVSARLLRLMEWENITPPGHHLSSESWPQTVALHYGLKAVTVPHGVYMEKAWPAQAAEWIFNNGDQPVFAPGYDGIDPHGEGAGGPDSTFGLEREFNWAGSTWYYQNRHAERLYKRWLGHEVEGIGGSRWEEEHGRYCLPPMLLHPVKSILDPDSLVPTPDRELSLG